MRSLFRDHGRTGLSLRQWRRQLVHDCPRFTGCLIGGGPNHQMIRVVLPFHLRNLARVQSEVQLEVSRPITLRAVLDALENRYPMLQGTIRDHVTKTRRPFLRFFACEQDLSHDSPDAPLPEPVSTGAEPLLVIGAI